MLIKEQNTKTKSLTALNLNKVIALISINLSIYTVTYLYMLPHFLLTSSIYRGLIRIWPIWRNPHQYTPDHPGVCDDVNLKTLVQTRMGDMNGDDSRSAI